MSEKTFTQEEVNIIVQNRLTQEKEKYNKIIHQKESEALEKSRMDTLVHALEKGGAVDVSAISKILNENVHVDDTGKVVFINGDNEPVSVEEGVLNYLKDNQWATKQPTGPSYHPARGENADADTMKLRQAMGLRSI